MLQATDYINALTPAATCPVAIGVVLVNRHTGEERIADLLCDDDSFFTVCTAVRRHFTADWGLYESWEISDEPRLSRPIALTPAA